MTADPVPDDPRRLYADDGWADLSDAELVAAVARSVSVPRRDPADSFVLHAPLEVVARAALLPHVRPDGRGAGRLRVLSVAVGVAAAGPPVDEPHGRDIAPDAFEDPAAAARALHAAVAAGDLDGVDRAARWLGRAASPAELRRLLAADVVPRLSAAAHAPIFLYQLPRVSPRGEITGELLRGLARELARRPDWRLGWIDEPPAPADGDLAATVARVVDLGAGGSDFIRPTMDRVDATGFARRTIGPLTTGRPDAHGPALLRVAARSMLLDRADADPYGWTHCLTLPQAALALAPDLPDPVVALRVAATHVLGFRASLGDVAVDRELDLRTLPDPGVPVDEALAIGPSEAAGAVAHARCGAAELASALATVASVRHDAHQVKYTLACLDAAAADPAHARLYLSAAAHLIGWWSAHGDPTDPLGADGQLVAA